jgi:hypothetical protein
LGTARTISWSSRLPTLLFQPGIAAMYACTGPSPSPFAICGLPPDSITTPSLFFVSLVRLALGAPALAFFFATFFVATFFLVAMGSLLLLRGLLRR